MGEPIGWCSMWPDQEDRCRCDLGVYLTSLSSTQSGEPDAGCQLPPTVDHGGTHRSTLSPTSPCVCGRRYPPTVNPSGEASPCHPSRAPLRCGPHRRSSRISPSLCSVSPYIPSAKGGSSCARGSVVGGGTHVSRLCYRSLSQNDLNCFKKRLGTCGFADRQFFLYKQS